MGFAYVIPRFIEDKEHFLIASDETLSNTARMDALIKSGPRILEGLQISMDLLGYYRDIGTFDIMDKLANHLI